MQCHPKFIFFQARVTCSKLHLGADVDVLKVVGAATFYDLERSVGVVVIVVDAVQR